ncbi:zinc-binding protein A33-like isoform X1 [Ambystoma mexicanum]|uniref:zinc-binding protein A33-like isoform X1 n=1 Tax=Ambystoma mexicanum TaxID=8296 RepID=UPI0037E8F847
MDLGKWAAVLDEVMAPASCLGLLNDLGVEECGPCLGRVGGALRKRALAGCRHFRVAFPPEACHTGRLWWASLGEKVRRAAARARQGRPRTECAEHEEKLKLFCQEDGELACLICRDALRHGGHCFLPLQDAVEVHRVQLISGLNPLQFTLRELQELMGDQEERISQLKEGMSIYREHIGMEFQKLHQFLYSREEELVAELQREGEPTLKDMETNLSRIQEDCRRIQELITDTQIRLQREDAISFLTDIKAFLQNCREGQEKAILAQHVVLSRELTVGQFRGPIQYGAWKAMKSILSPDLSCLTMDAATAHPELLVSEDCTRVRWGSAEHPGAVRPEKGFHTIFALGETGYNSGRHYWEVEVGKKASWTVGVASELIGRKEGVELKEGNGVWAIWLRNGFIYRASPKPLIPRAKPQKLGVYLDYEGGQVSFYNADDMSHLYTFSSTFVGKLFPFFDPGFSYLGDNGDPLRIIHPCI